MRKRNGTDFVHSKRRDLISSCLILYYNTILYYTIIILIIKNKEKYWRINIFKYLSIRIKPRKVLRDSKNPYG